MVVKKIEFIKKINEYGDVYSFYFKRDGLDFEAGQFCHLLVEDGKQREYPGGGKPSSIISYLCRGSQSSPRRQLFIEPRRDSGVRRRVRMREIGHSQIDYAAVKAAGSRD